MLRQTAVLLSLVLASPVLHAQEPIEAIAQTIAQAQKDKRSVVLYVNGATVGGGITRVEGNQWVELKNQEFGRVIVRMDKIDAVGLR